MRSPALTDERREAILAAYARHASRFDAIADRRGGPPAPSRPAPPARFEHQAQVTTRELDVLRLAAEGCTNEEIGRALHVAVETVKSHVRRAAVKLEARNRTHAVAIALRRGLLV